MPFAVKPRVRETSISTGVGDYALLGAPSGYRPFADVGANNLTRVHVTDGTNWEEGIYTYRSGPDRLERTHILGSSNAGAAVNWAAGTRTLRCGPIAATDVPRKLSKDIAGAGTVTLTQNEQRNEVIELTGALTGNRTIEVDTTVAMTIWHNNTSGAFAVTVKVAGQTGVVVPQGRRAFLYCDGVDVKPGGVAAHANLSEFQTGTATTWRQTSAPLGWTKSTTHNDKAMRIVSGTVGSGGATGFTSVFGSGKVTGGKTLAVADIPSHSHSQEGSTGTGILVIGSTVGDMNTTQTGATGGGGSHDHTLSLDLHYVDVIEATKD